MLSFSFHVHKYTKIISIISLDALLFLNNLVHDAKYAMGDGVLVMEKHRSLMI